MIQKSVLVKEVLECLDLKPNENIIDGTIGEGGHAQFLLEKIGPNGRLLGIDWDIGQIENSRQKLAEYENRIIFVNDSYANLKEIVAKNNFEPVNGILLDVGYSSWQIEASQKGFSFNNKP